MTQLYAAYKRKKKKDSLESHTNGLKVKGWKKEKGSPCKQSPGVSGGGYTTRMEENICK